MKTYDIEQRSPEWYALRLGKWTASSFDKLITPKTGKLSSQADAFENRCVAERITGDPIDDFGGTIWTERGKELEDEAVEYYELERNVDTEKVGFCTNDEGTYGCSPDRLVGEDGLLEIKCVAPHTLIGLLLSQDNEKEYYPQRQGQLLVTGRKWVDILFYHPKIKPLLMRVERDEDYIKLLSDALEQSNKNIEEKLAKCIL
jgi:hypothetical protein